jgi:integrase
MSGSKIPNNTRVKIDGGGTGIVKSSRNENDGTIYDVEIEGTGLCFPFSQHRLEIIRTVGMQTMPVSVNTSTRFQSIEGSDIDKLVHNQENRNTLKKTLYDMSLLKLFLEETLNEKRPIECIPPPELSDLLCKFFLGVRKSDGSNYEPNTLRTFMSSIDRHLRRMKYGFQIISSVEFAKVREVLKAKQKDLKSEGKGNLSRKSDAITDEEIDKLWENELLGVKNPESVINSLWLFTTIYFGLRGSDEHRSMAWGDICLQTDNAGSEFLTFNERQSKTRQGSNPRDTRVVKPKMWANLECPTRCPVHIYKFYAEKRPSDFCNPDDPFYLATTTKCSAMTNEDQWFKRQPIGVNKLGSIMKRMTTAAGIIGDKKLTSHSARKHLVQKLSENNVPANQIMQITGHKNLQSINNYSSLNEVQHRNISAILSNSTATQQPGSATLTQFQFNQRNTAVQSSSHNSRATNTVVNVTGGIQNLINGNIFGGRIVVNLQNDSNCSHSKKRPRVIYDSDSDADD